jgi:hypothetical protein
LEECKEFWVVMVSARRLAVDEEGDG